MKNKSLIREIEILFPIVWNNIYIKSNIFKHLKIYNLNYSLRKFNSIKEFSEFKYKQYLNEIEIGNLIDSFEFKIPFNVESIQIDYEFIKNKSLINNNYILPLNIKILKLINWPDREQFLPNQILKNGESSNINKLVIKFQKNKDINGFLPAIKFSSNIINLKLFENLYLIDKESLPKKLKKLNLDSVNHSLIEKGSLPQSLCELKISGIDSIECSSDYIPNDIYNLNLSVSNGWYIVSNGYVFPKNLKVLNIDCQQLNFEIPSSLEYLSIRIAFYSDLTFNYIPFKSNKLKSLNINLKSLINSSGESLLNKSLERLIISSDFNKSLKPNILPDRLIYLEFNNNNSFNDILFPTIDGYNNGDKPLIESNIFSKSLTHLDLGDYFNQIISINVLPQNLKTLILGLKFNQSILDNSIPYNLELMIIKNQSFNKTFNKLSNPITLVDCNYYYKQFLNNQNQLISFKLSYSSQFSLINAINLKILDLTYYHLNEEIIKYLPIDNKINTIIIGDKYSNKINISDFKIMENLIIKGIKGGPLITTTTTTTTILSKENKKQNLQIEYNFHSLKTIQVNYKNTIFIDSLNPIYFQFIKLQKE